MYYRLSPSQTKELLSQPETGMGYQAVEAHLPGLEILNRFIVLNSELAVELNEAAPLVVKEIAHEGIEKMLGRAMDFRQQITRVIHYDQEIKPVSVPITMKEEHPDGSEVFVRRSLFREDKRIDLANRCLLPGSFTTTHSDSLRYLHRSEDPLIQLAMENGVRGKYGFYLIPRRTDLLQRGQSDPRNGAKEIFFRNGTSQGTYLKCEMYFTSPTV
jgi:hypothetical protein